MDDSSTNPLAYVGEDKCTHTWLSVVCLVDHIENAGFEVEHTQVNQHVLLNAMGMSLHDNTILLREFVCMAGDPLLVHLHNEFSLVWYVNHGPWDGEGHLGEGVVGQVPIPDVMKDECGSHGDPDQADIGEEAALD